MIRSVGMVLALASVLGSACARVEGAAAPVRPARIFSDGAVLQRDAAIPVWGWAAAGADVTVAFAGRTRSATADAAGAWRVEFPAMNARGPHEMLITGDGARVIVRDILVGDVWVASGQSNMGWPVSLTSDATAAISEATDRNIRELAVPHSYSERPETELAGGQWSVADAEHVGTFSGVGYFFARELRKSVGVPIGIIHTSWGGANIETWMSRTALGISDSALAVAVADGQADTAALRVALSAKIGPLPSVDSGLVGTRAAWAAPDLADDTWATIAAPGLWESAGYEGMNGVGWYRTSFTLDAAELREPIRLSLGPIDDSDITWVNGVEVGRTEEKYAEPRAYTIPTSALRAGRNVIAVRVDDTGGGGGIYGPADSVYVEVRGDRRSLAGTWRFKVGMVSVEPDGQRINKVPTILYNRMIHPLLDVPIRGVIWYQGESNANSMEQATEYRRLFSTMISSWRREWRGTGGRDFPFLWVQLPNFGRVDSIPPATATWAAVRESQAAALALPNTGQVVAIDLGGADELHPRNKKDVGARLALKAREVAYGERVTSSGPTYQRHTVSDGRVTIELANVDGGLVSRSTDGGVTGFSIAASDRRFVWANATIDGDRVVVWSDRVAAPVAVRYLWSNSPRPPVLYNREGLPAAPFRTDSW